MPNTTALPMRPLGKTGMQVTQLGYGSMGLRGPRTWGVRVVSEEGAEEFLNSVLDAGINFIDTAPDYGCCEERIGKYISSRRNEFYLATKCGCDYVQHDDHIEIAHRWDKDVIKRNVETSLQRLNTDYLDLLQFHGGDATSLTEAGLIEQLLDFKSQGVIRHIGVSSKIPHLEGLIALGVFETFQIPFSCLAPEHSALMGQAADAGAGIIVRGGVAQGGPDAEIQRANLNEIWEKAQLDDLLNDDLRRAELILRFTLGHRACHTTIVGTCNKNHLRDNLLAAQKGPLPEALNDEIKERVERVLANS